MDDDDMRRLIAALDWCGQVEPRLAEKGVEMIAWSDESLLAEKIADDLGLELEFRYSGRARHLLVEALYGETLDDVVHVRGLDLEIGERRSFRCDGMESLRLPGLGSVEGRLGWFLGQAARWRAGAPISSCPFVVSGMRRAVEVETLSDFSGVECFRGEVLGLDYGYRAAGAILRFDLSARPAGGGRLRRLSCNYGPGAYGRVVTALRQAEGAEIADIMAWARAVGEVETDGIDGSEGMEC